MQQLAASYVCVMDECFDLAPPKWFKHEWLQNPKSTQLFLTFAKNSPKGLIPEGPTVQGLYCMTPDGEFLAGHFSRSTKERTIKVLEDGLTHWRRRLKQSNVAPKPVPGTIISPELGDVARPGGLKLEVAVRDLPRGNDTTPGQHFWERGAFNLNWIALTRSEAGAFVTTIEEPQAVSRPVLEKIALRTLKDSVRGQLPDWKVSSLRHGAMTTRCLANEGGHLHLRFNGRVSLQEDDRRYTCQIFGRAIFDSDADRFTAFDLCASGQRSGAGQFNARNDDRGPAPMGVALSLFRVPE